MSDCEWEFHKEYIGRRIKWLQNNTLCDIIIEQRFDAFKDLN